jgi:hypothetical protein
MAELAFATIAHPASRARALHMLADHRDGGLAADATLTSRSACGTLTGW